MRKLIGLSVFVLVVLIQCSFGQKAIKELPSNINHPAVNLYAPYISGDGQSMIYLSDYTDEGHHSMHYATKKGVSNWIDGVEVNKLVNKPTHNFRGGYSLNFDGSELYYTSRKSGLGGYEIWYSRKQGNNWAAPKNIGAPVNSASNEGSPVLSPDGRYLYFMRCETMSEYKGATGCKLFVSVNSKGRWQQPEELPANINTGNSQTPRLLADGETLLFSSDKFGGKGGLDILMSKKLENGWSDPVLLDFANDGRNNSFVSVPAKGRYMYADIRGDRSFNLVQLLIPEEYQPKGVMRIKGSVTNQETGEPVDAKLLVFNIDERKRLFNYDIGSKGEFTLVLNEGASYDLSITGGQGSMFYSKIYELDSIGPRDKQTLRVALEPMEAEKPYDSPVKFMPNSSELSDNSTFELRRIANIMRKNSSMNIELTVLLKQYMQDSTQSHVDLTEVMIDTIHTEVKVPVNLDIADSLSQETPSDTLWNDTMNADTLEIQPMDSVRYEIVKSFEVKYTYHNDRTETQAENIKAYLVGRGVEEERISIRSEKMSDELVDPKAFDESDNVAVRFRILNL